MSRQQRFARETVERYHALDPLRKSIRASVPPPQRNYERGHPDFDGLAVGESEGCVMAIAFIDMAKFTYRSFWESPDKVTRLASAVLTQIALVVEESGGHTLGLRGDGLMAGWGGVGSDPHVDVAMCAAACALSLDAGRGALNELLVADGIEPVQLRAGADHGYVDFTRTGTAAHSEINVVGHAANFAAKCEKYANAWEVVVGAGCEPYIDSFNLMAHPRSPKTYTYCGERRTYAFYDLAWTGFLAEATSAINQVGGTPTSSITPRY